MVLKPRRSCSSTVSYHAKGVRPLCQILSPSWLRIISHAASRSILCIYQQSSQYRSYKNFVPPYLHDRPCSVILHALTGSPTAPSFLLSPSMMLTARRASLRWRRQVDISTRSTLAGTQLIRCLCAHAKIGYGTICHVSTSLQCLSTVKSGNGSSYLHHTSRVPTSQWM